MNINSETENIRIRGNKRNLSTTLLTAMIMGEIPSHLIDVAKGTIDDLENGKEVPSPNQYTGVRTSAVLSPEDLEQLAKAKAKRERKAAKKAYEKATYDIEFGDNKQINIGPPPISSRV